MNGLGISGSVNEVWTVNIRNGGASTPTAASPSVANSQLVLHATGGLGQATVVLAGTFAPGAGTQTLSIFYARTSGSGNGIPVFQRELYVVNIGPA